MEKQKNNIISMLIIKLQQSQQCDIDKSADIEICGTEENLEIDPYSYGQQDFGKGSKVII